jgi:DNA-binding transcriptional LysR family regulator
MLQVERLRALHAVAVHGSVSAAASALHVTTSAVSQQIAKLERETDSQLIERNGRGVRLTDAARLLVAHADGILSLVEQAESDFEAHRGQVVGRLTVGAFATAARGLLPELLGVLGERYPRLTVSMREVEPPAAIRQVLRGELDLAIVQDWHSLPLGVPDGIERAPLLDDVADVVVPERHRLAGRGVVDVSELIAEPWVSSPPGAVCYDLLVHTVRSHDAEPRIVHMAAEYETQLKLVAANLGIAIFPRLGRGPVPPGVALLRTEPKLLRSVYVIWRKQVGSRPGISATVEALRSVADIVSARADLS